jgi:hypothetical protein
VGVGPVGSGALNTLSALFAGEDHADPYFVSGGGLALRRALSPTWSVSAEGWAERQRAATLTSSFSFFGDVRPVRPIDPTDLFLGGRLALRRGSSAEASSWLDTKLSADFGDMDPTASSTAAEAGPSLRFVRPRLDAGWGRRWTGRDATLLIDGGAGTAFGDIPVQGLYLIGGRGTVPGYQFRDFGGDRYAAVRGVFSATVWQPWIRGRLLAAAGWTGASSAALPAMGRAGVRTTGQVLPGVGIGVGIFHDILHVDLARGLGDDGVWEVIVEANRSFWDFL